MPLAKDYVCYSVRRGQRQGIPAKTLIDIGVGCKVTAIQAERIARFVAKMLRVKLGKVYIKDTQCGYGNRAASCITLPHFILHDPKPYMVQYIAHEVSHLHPNAHGHESSFKRVERRATKLFGMGIRYKRAYPRELFALKDGRVLYEDAPRERRQKVQIPQPSFSSEASA